MTLPTRNRDAAAAEAAENAACLQSMNDALYAYAREYRPVHQLIILSPRPIIDEMMRQITLDLIRTQRPYASCD